MPDKSKRTKARDASTEKILQNLLEAKERAEQYLNLAGTIIISLDTSGKITLLNKKGCEVLGWKERSLIGKNWFDTCIPKEIVPEIKKAFKKLKTGDFASAEHYTNKVITKKNEKRLICWHNTALKDKKGKIIGLLSSGEDITERKNAEEKLKESEEKLRNLISASADFMWEVNQKGEYTGASENIKKILGYSQKEMLGKTPFDFMPKDEAKRVGAIFSKIMRKKENIVDLENWNIHKNGQRVCFLTNGTPLFDENKKFLGYSGIDKVITEQKKAEEALKENEEKFRTLYEGSRDAIMTLAPPDWRFTSGNPAAIKLFGVKKEEEFTAHTPDAFSPKYQPDGRLSSVKAKKMIMQAMKEGSNFFEWTHKTIQGKAFPANVLLTRITIKGKQLLQATVRDLSARRKAERGRQESKEQLQIIFNTTTEGIMMTNVKTKKISYMNPAISHLLGYEDEELVGKTINKIYPEKAMPKVIEVFEKQARGELKIAFALPCKKKDGTIIHCDISTSSMMLSGVRTNVGFFRDVTERAEKEREIQQRLEELEQFNKFVVQRELKMVELKKKIKELEKKVKRMKK